MVHIIICTNIALFQQVKLSTLIKLIFIWKIEKGKKKKKELFQEDFPLNVLIAWKTNITNLIDAIVFVMSFLIR